MKLVATAPARRLGAADLRKAVDALSIGAVAEGIRAASFETAPFAGRAVAPVADSSAAPASGLLLVWIPGASFTDELRAVATELGWQDATPVEEHVVHDLGLHAGVARIGFLRRRPELSREEFARHWIDVHGPLVLAHDPLFVRYVANVVTAPDSAVDGIVEQYFPDAATWAEHDRRILEERPAVSADIQTFLGGMEQLVATPLATAGG